MVCLHRRRLVPAVRQPDRCVPRGSVAQVDAERASSSAAVVSYDVWCTPTRPSASAARTLCGQVVDEDRLRRRDARAARATWAKISGSGLRIPTSPRDDDRVEHLVPALAGVLVAPRVATAARCAARPAGRAARAPAIAGACSNWSNIRCSSPAAGPRDRWPRRAAGASCCSKCGTSISPRSSAATGLSWASSPWCGPEPGPHDVDVVVEVDAVERRPRPGSRASSGSVSTPPQSTTRAAGRARAGRSSRRTQAPSVVSTPPLCGRPAPGAVRDDRPARPARHVAGGVGGHLAEELRLQHRARRCLAVVGHEGDGRVRRRSARAPR